MNVRARELAGLLRLAPHPEGGAYREVHRSPAPPGRRAASSAIYFLLEAGQQSRWHRVDAEEAWHHYEGGPLELLWTAGEEVDIVRVVLGPAGAGDVRPLAVVPAGAWQAARPLGDYALAGCTVAPAFEFAGFSLLASDAARAERFRRRHPGSAFLI